MGRMQIRHFRRFRQNGPFLAGDKGTVYQKHGLCQPDKDDQFRDVFLRISARRALYMAARVAKLPIKKLPIKSCSMHGHRMRETHHRSRYYLPSATTHSYGCQACRSAFVKLLVKFVARA